MMKTNILILNVVILFAYVFGDYVKITIDQGILQGKKEISRNGRTFNAFTGIPYAKPPINNLRFQPPVAASKWKGIFDATKPHPRCLQLYSYLKNSTVIGSEDCLYLNVYTPNVNPIEKLAVMIFIHGGAFITGSASDYDPSLFMDQDVVLLTINYRLGPFGFLTTTTYHMLGNDGLKDQAMAIKWVKNNIAAFGGNSEKITVFGQGAGGISAHLHMMSPLSKDLISGVIAQSGTAVAYNSLMPYFLSVRYTKFLADSLNCPTDADMDDMVRCLLYKPGKKILEKMLTFTEFDIEPITIFKPVMEPDLPGAFITEDPVHTILKGKAAKVPFLTGITSDEGDLRTTLLFKYPNMIDEFNQQIDRYLPMILNYKYVAIYKNLEPATQKIKAFYLKNRDLSEKNRKEFSKMYTDALYLLSANFATELHLKGSKESVYYYVFGYKGSESYCKLYDDSVKNTHGVCNSDELLYLFNDNLNFPNYKRNEAENQLSDLMVHLWTTFAKQGTPSPKNIDTLPVWKPYTINHPNHYFITNGTFLENLSSIFTIRSNFWKNLNVNENRIKLRDEL
ncbi:hypothetical protein FQR65_LT06591 [Abscondita terminalis]|nr:hypothetical protein FQR65_LT06591 [Abscondita terminalis]